MTPEELLFQDAKEALQKGDLLQARDLLTRLIKINHSNPEYWLWMSAAVGTKKERGYCLEEVLTIDPGNKDALKGLRLMGENIAESAAPVTPIPSQLNWKTSLETEPNKKRVSGKTVGKILGLVFLGLIVISASVGGILLSMRPKYVPEPSPIMRWSITPPATQTATATANSPTPQSTIPLAALLENTFTPTPLYVITPHDRSEAYTAALKAYDNQEWDKALEYFKQVLSVEPNSADLQFLIGEIYRFQKSYSEASAAYDSAINLDPSFGPAYLGKGRVFLLLDPPDYENANVFFLKAIKNDPKLSEAILELSSLSLLTKNPKAALEWLDKLEFDFSNAAPVEYIRAQAYRMLGEEETALSHILLANTLDRSYLPVYKFWGQLLQEKGQFADSIPPLLIYQTYAPLDLESDVLLAKADMEIGDYQKALLLVDAAISADSKNVDALVTRGDVYMYLGETSLAGYDYDLALELNKRSFEATIGKGRTQLAITYAGNAYTLFLKADDFTTTEVQKAIALFWRAVALEKLSDHKGALQEYISFLTLTVENIPAPLRATAIAEYNKIITPTPTFQATMIDLLNPSATPKK
ncbi:MAG: tetratricopeptide repeat protein [Chloroflexi bacterium]|nr:tetratricopeptide repeat protein [Chloroflexota bacterium]